MTSHSDGASVCDAEITDDAERSPSASIAGDHRFPRSARLLTGKDYGLVFRRNRRYTDRYWTILVTCTSSSDARLGLAIAKKRAKRAVDRNRLKRIAREAFRHHRSSLPGHQLVVMNRDAAATAEPAALRQAMDRLLSTMARHAEHSGSTFRQRS